MTLYPGSIDGYSSLPLRIDRVHEIRADDVNRLRNAIVAIEQELGVEPSSVFATVRARLDDIGDASSQIESHLADPIDAHDASAISILDTSERYTATDVEGALGEIASVLPIPLDVIGEDKSTDPNHGIPSFASDGYILHHVYSNNAGTDVVKTQPIDITGVYIIDVGINNGESGTLKLNNHSPATVSWKAAGDSFGTTLDISGMSAGDIATLSSGTTSKKIRIVRTEESFPTASPIEEIFDIPRLDAQTGAYSYDGVGITPTTKITRASVSSTGTSLNQFMIGGKVYPADTGTLVLQRKLRLASSEFVPIATLNLGNNFDEDLRGDGQPVYMPSLSGYDTVLLYDRHPARMDYQTLPKDANGDSIYENFNIGATFPPYQVAKYKIPISNSTIANGDLESPTDITASEIENNVSSYRVVHYKAGVTDFVGEPSASDIISISDTIGTANDGDSSVRMSNLFVDSSASRPSVSSDGMAFLLRPELDAESVTKNISGVNYYNGSGDLFDVSVRSDYTLFANSYLEEGILRFTTNVFEFPNGSSIDVTRIMDDGYTEYSDSNLPTFSDRGFYVANASINPSDVIYPASNKFSMRSNLTAAFYDPFGTSGTSDAYGFLEDGTELNILVNSYGTTRATDTQEYFTDESRRVGTLEVFDFILDEDQFTGAGTYGTLETWDSSAALDSVTSGELQCGGTFASEDITDLSGLIYPRDDYSATNIRPTQVASADYSSFTGTRIYQRLFSIGRATSGGMLRIVSSAGSETGSLISFDNISYDNASRPIKIEVKIPGTGGNATGWMDISKPFQTNSTDDGDGALVGPIIGSTGDFVIPFTFGIKDTSTTGNMIAVRVTYAPADGGTNVTDAKLKTLSMIELLEP